MSKFDNLSSKKVSSHLRASEHNIDDILRAIEQEKNTRSNDQHTRLPDIRQR